MGMSTPSNWSAGSRASHDQAMAAKANIAFPLKILPYRWRMIRKHLIVDTPIGWKARRAAPWVDGRGSLVFTCYDPKLFGNATPEWIDRMAAKVQLVTEP